MAAPPPGESMLPPLEAGRSAHGWHTSPPEGRYAKRMVREREMREKAMLANRREGYQRMETRRNPIEPLVHAAGWVPNAERLRNDPPKELRRERAETKAAKDDFLARRREKRLQREATRWEEIDRKEALVQHRVEQIAGTGKRNLASVGYDLVSHRYGSSTDAAAAKFKDDAVAYRAKKRSRDLFEKANMSGYNIITGASTKDFVKVPPIPSRPEP
eukprot:Hpha_TRINITY_DN10496_c0_g1::TRINITY_DN10496_c0_g1_i1::g.193433::m.193433